MKKPINKIFYNLDKIFSILGFFIGLILTYFLIINSIQYMSIGITISLSCSLYYYLYIYRNYNIIKNNFDYNTRFKWKHRTKCMIILLIINFLLFSFLLLFIQTSIYQRPFIFFILIPIFTTIIAIQIFLTNLKKYNILIILQIIALSIILRWSLPYIYPNSLLGGDPWGLSNSIFNIINTGQIDTQMGNYFYMPIYHLYVSTTSIVTNLNYKYSTFFSISLLEIISIIFIYFICKKFLNEKIGLLASLIIGITSIHIMWGWWIIPMTLGFSLFLIIIYLIIRTVDSIIYKYILIFMFLILILTHHLSALITSIVIISLFLGIKLYDWIYKNKKVNFKINYALCFILPVSLITYWIFFAFFFNYFIYMGSGKGNFPIYSVINSMQINSLNIWLEINKFSQLLFYGLAIIGILFMVNKRNLDQFKAAIILSSSILLSAVFLGTFANIPGILSTDRWFVFLCILLSIPIAITLYSLYQTKTNHSFFKKFCLFSIIFILSFSMVLNTEANFDSPLSENISTFRHAFTNNEIQASKSIPNLFNTKLTIDLRYAQYLFIGRVNNSLSVINQSNIISKFSNVNGLIIFREYITQNNFQIFNNNYYMNCNFNYNPYFEFTKLKFNHIYDSEQIKVFFKMRDY